MHIWFSFSNIPSNLREYLLKCWPIYQKLKKNFHFCHSLLRRGLFVLWGGFRVVGRLGRKKKRARGARWARFPLPIVPRALSIFVDYWYFDGDTQREPLRRREFLSLRKKTAGDGRNAIRLLFSASSSIDACDKIYSLPWFICKPQPLYVQLNFSSFCLSCDD